MVEQNVMDEQPLSAKYRGHLYSRGLNSQLLYNANGMGLLLKSYMYYNRGERSHLLPHALSAAIETVSAQLYYFPLLLFPLLPGSEIDSSTILIFFTIYVTIYICVLFRSSWVDSSFQERTGRK